MVAEPWILKIGGQVSSNLKHALYVENLSKPSNKKPAPQDGQTIGILSFEVANAMSKIIHLHKSLSDHEISKLKNETLKSEGVKTLVSSDENLLLELALVEKLDDLNRVASVVSRLGMKCTIPALQGFEHVYGDISSGVIDIKELSFLVKDMDSMIRKMERYVNSTSNLYSEMEAMNELELTTKKFQHNQLEDSRKGYAQKLAWQKEDVKHLKDVSLWSRTFDKVVELLARTVCTVYARIYVVLGAGSKPEISNMSVSSSQVRFHGSLLEQRFNGVDVIRNVRKEGSLTNSTSTSSGTSFGPKMGFQKCGDCNNPCGMGPGRMFMECLSLSSSASKVDDEDDGYHDVYDDKCSQVSSFFSSASGLTNEHPNFSGCFVNQITGGRFTRDQRRNCKSSGPRTKFLMNAPPETVGGSALALHYANVIIVVEKLLQYPHLVGDEARDDLYKMLPTSLRKCLKISLKSYVKDLAIYDAPLAHDWRDRLDGILKWLAPLAHSMIRWQSERNFEQHQIVTRKNVLLLETMYFADREKTEAAICELLVGLNCMCRYEQQRNALFDCASSFDFEVCMDWQSQLGS